MSSSPLISSTLELFQAAGEVTKFRNRLETSDILIRSTIRSLRWSKICIQISFGSSLHGFSSLTRFRGGSILTDFDDRSQRVTDFISNWKFHVKLSESSKYTLKNDALHTPKGNMESANPANPAKWRTLLIRRNLEKLQILKYATKNKMVTPSENYSLFIYYMYV